MYILFSNVVFVGITFIFFVPRSVHISVDVNSFYLLLFQPTSQLLWVDIRTMVNYYGTINGQKDKSTFYPLGLNQNG